MGTNWKALNLQEEIDELNKEIEILRKGLAAVRTLMNESAGVAGLHLNGDIAEWSDIEQGGRYEAWMLDFNAAENLILLRSNEK